MAKIVVVLGDQLSLNLPSLQAANPQQDLVVMAELAEEASYVAHHKQKLAFLFAAMRHFAEELRSLGWRVSYHRFDPDCPHSDFQSLLQQVVTEHGSERLLVTRCGEWRLQQQINRWAQVLGIDVEQFEDSRFFCSLSEFQQWAKGRKQLRLEYFYRYMRRQTGLLMEPTDKPVGGRWNFDADNRKKYDAKVGIPELPVIEKDPITEDVLALVECHFSDNPGQLDHWWLPVTRRDAELWFDAFLESRLAHFGRYQDAMVTDEPFMFHGMVSALINVGLLDPMMVCQKAQWAYHRGEAPLNAVEGFIRQILGWREYVRGLYWLWMPEYGDLNALEANQPLPALFWGKPTKMHCLSQSIGQTLEYGYAHHIQRLMVIGNFALMVGVSPKLVCDWYLAVYVDAFEWVELPNTLGMALHGDGGRMASKPYAASGRYINKQSDYCKSCSYQVVQAVGDEACPFNSLYWHFMNKHRQRLQQNPRVGVIYRSFDGRDEAERQGILSRAATIIANPDEF